MTGELRSIAPDAIAVFGEASDLAGAFDITSLLNNYEVGRAKRIRPVVERETFRAGHALLRLASAWFCETNLSETTVVQTCDVCGEAHGKPRLHGRSDVSLSLSHSRGMVGVVVANVPSGIDIESRPFDEEITSVLSADEVVDLNRGVDRRAEFARLWTRKEAAAKALGLQVDEYSSVPVGYRKPVRNRIMLETIPVTNGFVSIALRSEGWPLRCATYWLGLESTVQMLAHIVASS